MPSLRLLSIPLLLAAGGVQANQLVNGGFETPVIAAASFQTIAGGSEPAGFGWLVVFNSVDIISNGVLGVTSPMAAGQQALDLVGAGTGGAIQQAFSTAAGTTYRLSFAYANNPIVTATASATATLTAGATTLFSGSVTHSTSSFGNLNWSVFSTTFAGTGGLVTLRFDNTVGSTNGGVFLDAVDVSPVPEPAVALLWLGGLAALALRRQQR